MAPMCLIRKAELDPTGNHRKAGTEFAGGDVCACDVRRERLQASAQQRAIVHGKHGNFGDTGNAEPITYRGQSVRARTASTFSSHGKIDTQDCLSRRLMACTDAKGSVG
jgi:hypothetical protein